MYRNYGLQQASARLVRALRARWAQTRSAVEPGSTAAPEPQRTAVEFAQDMQTLVQRQVQVCLMFTGSVLEVFAHPDHLRHRFGRAAWIDKVQTRFEPDVDHTLTLQSSQLRMSAQLLGWTSTVARTPPQRF